MKLAVAAVGLAAQLGASAALFPKIPPTLPVSKGDAVIMMTGSTNTTGYRIVLSQTGAAEYVSASGRATGEISSALRAKLFSDLAAAQPLDTIPHAACMKSASFGSSLFVYWEHHRSPDLTCLASARGAALREDAAAAASELHIHSSIRGLERPMLPSEFHKALPTATPSNERRE
jgi:hypothetical protein